MPDFAIVADTSCDLTRELRERFGVDGIFSGILVYPDGREEKTDLDWENISSKEFYGSMVDKKVLYTTSLPNSWEISAELEKHLAAGRDIYAVTISSAISGTYNALVLAAEELMKKYPQRKIYCIDSLRYSAAVALHIANASRVRAEGKSAEEAATWSEANKHRVHQMGPIDDLFFCKRMGRISAGKAIAGSLVGVRPMGDFNRGGLSQVIGKARGRKKALMATISYMKKTIEDAPEQIVFVAHSDRASVAAELAEKIRAEISPREVIVTDIGQWCGASIGPGLVAAYYLGREITENLEEEARLLAEATSGK